MFDAQTLQIREVNRAALDLYGYSEEEFLQLTIMDLKPKEDRIIIEKTKRLGLNNYHNEVRHVKKSGEEFSIEVSTHAIQLPSGEHYIVSGHDLTEKHQLQQKIVEEKLAAEKEVAKAIISTQENERSVIGKELHDNVCQLLTTAKLYIENIKHFPELSDEFADKGIELLLKSIQETRCLSKQLVPPVMGDLGFEASIIELIHHYEVLSLFNVQLEFDVSQDSLEKDLKLNIYRILQELLNNIVKYARPSEVKVSIRETRQMIKVVVEDDGVGFDMTKVSTGLGLSNIQNRADVFQGTVHIDTAVGEGCKTVITFPIKAAIAQAS